jgi:hypothetical protein
MHAETRAAHLQQILTAYPDEPILLLHPEGPRRAPWHRGAAIRALVDAHPRLEILQFPVAAPDVNPQEHVWKATREAVSHNHTVAELPTLAEQFETHLQRTPCSSSFLAHRGFFTVYPTSIC